MKYTKLFKEFTIDIVNEARVIDILDNTSLYKVNEGFINETVSNNPHLIEVIPEKRIHHTSNPHVRDVIAKHGLVVQGASATWLSDTNIKGKVIFAVNSSNKKDAWDSTYDDDVYEIDTTRLKNKWYNDPNFEVKDGRIITFENIPSNSIKLIYKGTGD